MAAAKNDSTGDKIVNLPKNSGVDMYCVKGDKVFHYKGYTLGELQKMPRKAGWQYLFYQVGFGQFKVTNTIEKQQ